MGPNYVHPLFRATREVALWALLCCSLLLGYKTAALSQTKKYTLTIFVNQGPNTSSAWRSGTSGGVFSGHVFIGLSDGNATIYRGYYPNKNYTVMDDYDDASTRNYELKKTYPITESGYKKAKDATICTVSNEQWRKELAHCGAFAEAALHLGGVDISVPEGPDSKVSEHWMRTRPGNFAKFLKSDKTEGRLVTISKAERNTPDPDPTFSQASGKSHVYYCDKYGCPGHSAATHHCAYYCGNPGCPGHISPSHHCR